MTLHPLLHARAKPLRNIAVDHGLAALLSRGPREERPDQAASNGCRRQEPRILAMRAEDENQNVSAARNWQGDGGGIEKRNGKYPGESEMHDPGGNQAMTGMSSCCL